MTTVTRLAEHIGANIDPAGADDPRAELVAATIRAQEAGPGFLFAALPGLRTHGAMYAHQAAAGGAQAILTDPRGLTLLDPAALEAVVLVHPDPRAVLGEAAAEIYGRPSERLAVAGITGTSGKTTTTYFLEAALRAAGWTSGVIGTTGSRIGGQPIESSLTTPEAPEFQQLIATMAGAGAMAVAAEVSSHALELGRVDGTRFAVGAFLNLSQDHLDFHPTMEDYFAAKCRLFAPAEGSQVRPADRAVVVIDDDWGRRLSELRPDAVTVSGEPRTPDDGPPAGPEWFAGASTRTPRGTQTFTAHGPDTGELPVEIPLMGRFNVTNSLVALAIAVEMGCDPRQAAAGLASVAVPGRLEPVDLGQDFSVLVDYAHKPGAVEAVLASVRAQTTGRLAVVLGAGGDRDAEKRPLMGAAAASAADLVIVTDDNPRSEDPQTIRSEVLAGAVEAETSPGVHAEIREIGDRGAAIAAAVDWARPGDVVVIAGKGHETGQERAGIMEPFDDRLRAAEEIERRLAEESGEAGR